MRLPHSWEPIDLVILAAMFIAIAVLTVIWLRFTVPAHPHQFIRPSPSGVLSGFVPVS